MGLIHCPDCGTSVSEHANVCPKCSYPIQRIKQPQQTTTVYNTNNNEASSGLIAMGYIFACISLLFYPILFAPAGVIVGIVTISKGSAGHGVAHIILSFMLGIAGFLLGVFSYMI